MIYSTIEGDIFVLVYVEDILVHQVASLCSEKKSCMDVKLYEQMVGSLSYLALQTRKDILLVVLILGRFQKVSLGLHHQI